MSSDPLWALWGVYPMPVLDESPLIRISQGRRTLDHTGLVIEIPWETLFHEIRASRRSPGFCDELENTVSRDGQYPASLREPVGDTA